MGRLRETAVELEVPLHDVDVLGVVWHGHYYMLLETPDEIRRRLLG
jgi:acyl-CoA thioesterase FadM